MIDPLAEIAEQLRERWSSEMAHMHKLERRLGDLRVNMDCAQTQSDASIETNERLLAAARQLG